MSSGAMLFTTPSSGNARHSVSSSRADVPASARVGNRGRDATAPLTTSIRRQVKPK